MSEKLFDCVFIASDSKQRKKVRFANDHDKRMKVLNRDKFVVHYSKSFDQKMTQESILEYLDEHCDIDDQDTVDEAIARLNKNKTTFEDVRLAILSRQDTVQSDQVAV